MAFRDEGEALRQRAETLETELEAAQKELASHRGQAERLALVEQELAQARELLNRIDDRLGTPAAKARRLRHRIALGVAASAVLIVGGGIAWFGYASPGNVPPHHGPSTWHAPEPQQTATPAPAVEVAEPPPIEKRVRWNGRVRAATGHQQVAVGAPCTIDAVLRSNDKHDASISCGGEVLYRSTGAVVGSPVEIKASATEMPGMRAGTSQSVLTLDDTQPRRAGRRKATVDGERGRAEVRGLPPQAWVVQISLERYSEPYEGAFGRYNKHEELPFQERVHTKARVTKATGRAPAKVGDVCEATLRPSFSGGCRAFIRCGNESVHGDDPIAAHCKVENGKATLLDVPNDRWRVGVLWDIPGGKLSLDSGEIGPIWSLELTAE